jgi:hypothetical protein
MAESKSPLLGDIPTAIPTVLHGFTARTINELAGTSECKRPRMTADAQPEREYAMSSTAAAWARAQPLIGRKKQLLLTIALAVDETGSCRSVTQDNLAASCHCSVRQVRRLIKQLAGDKYLAHRSRGAFGGGRTSDLYVLPREARESNPDTHVRIGQNAGKPDI